MTLTASSNLADQGADVVFSVQATDNVGVASLTLTVGGTAVSLDGNNQAVVRMSQPGLFDAVATAADAAGNVGSSNTWQVGHYCRHRVCSVAKFTHLEGQRWTSSRVPPHQS